MNIAMKRWSTTIGTPTTSITNMLMRLAIRRVNRTRTRIGTRNWRTAHPHYPGHPPPALALS